MNNNDFNPSADAAYAFRQIFGPDEISPIGGYAGNSHFGYVPPLNPLANDPGWHVTTEVPGLKQGQTIPIRNFLSDFDRY